MVLSSQVSKVRFACALLYLLTQYEAIPFDGVSHHALGGGSYVFKENYPEYLAKHITNGPRVEVNIIIQPNSSPHFGTIFSMTLSFCVARSIAVLGLEPVVVVDLWDNAKAEQLTMAGVTYQKGLRSSGRIAENIDDYREIVMFLSKHYDVPFRLRMEDEFLREPGMPDIVREIVRDRDHLGQSLAPSSGKLAIRSECAVEGCGLVDKYGAGNAYDETGDKIHFTCPLHGSFFVHIGTECDRLQFNCQLFNLVIGRYYTRADIDHGYIQICGGDYAGFWQEQLLWRHLTMPLLIVYTPLIVDWSGSKLSKSLYLKQDAYGYLVEAEMDYILSYKSFKKRGMNLGVICAEVDLWVREPFRLFRCYTVHYVHMLFTRKDDLRLGIIHVRDRVNRA